MNRLSALALGATLLLGMSPLHANDWPMWRANPGRTASVTPALPEKLSVLWSRELGALKPAYRDVRLQFDKGYEPVVLGKRLFVASSRDDSVTAYATDTGAELWKVFADGPVRFAPVAGDGRVIFGSDDGVLRCVSADTGELLWQKRAVPNDRQLLGNGRLISVWPIRGGPVLHAGRVYFAAGVWPLEGVFIYCLDATSGREVWLNDRTGYLYGVHPHQAEAFGGVAPQGYLLVDGVDLVVPCSSAYPARFDLATGALKDFALPSAGRLPGGWFASTPDEKETQRQKRLGLLFDKEVNAVRHEDKPRAEGTAGVRRSFRAGGKEWNFDGPWPGVSGKVHSVLTADDKCFVVTEDGRLFALVESGRADLLVGRRALSPAEAARQRGPATTQATRFLAAAGADRGYALVLGLGEPGFLEALANQSQFKILALSDSNVSIAAARTRLAAARLYGERVALRQVAPTASGLPPYFANLIVVAPGATLPDPATLKQIFGWLRPYGGRLIGPESLARTAEAAQLPQASVKQLANGLVAITREGALAGSTNYKGDFQPSADELVKAPLGVLWFDDTLGNFKRAPQPKFIDGVMVSTDKDWLDESTRKGKVDYRLRPSLLSDVYTGRVLDAGEAPELRKQQSQVDLATIQQSQYRPATQKDDWNPGAPVAGTRVNPLTGDYEARAFPKSYGCDGGFDYGHLYTMRSGTAAFYDKRLDSGTIHVSGPRSGCTSSVIPANGVLNVPYFFEGCSCSYPLPMALSLVSLPPTFEQWAAWGATPSNSLAGKVERVGINFGAPGDRKTDDGTLWLGFPAVGGPSPKMEVRTEPAAPEFYYRHSVWIEGGEGWPWVGASGVKGLQAVTVAGLKAGTYTVRLTFAEPEAGMKAGGRKFTVRLQNQIALEHLDVLAESGGAMRLLTKTISKVAVTGGTLTVKLDAHVGITLLNGVEIVRAGLTMDPLPSPARVPGRQ
ncbi:MAG: PQQ-binding-like beta-propeller repeat protein [Verrucomicrobia bacterium]|nr:PQQ-binding-like beta-propeller repeat protein [Verrucomicrobiota bacterium]